ncbi:MAG: DUF4838 domain-containing protein [Verrucomicrobiaceae bacterium]|nr:DUF4838 domain-containing protein [Verrucomicrobiaceae bacterium]
MLPRLIFTFLLLSSSLWADVTLVRDGKAQAVIVTPEKPTRVVSYAAAELARHVEKACGVKLEIVSESTAKSGPRIFIGPCRESGVDTEKLAPESCVLRVTDAAVFIAGNDGGGDPLDTDTRAGTLWGVYEWLERDLGVRWLWPGELGTHVPKTVTIIAKSRDETIEPRFFRRHIRPGLGFESEHPALGFTKQAAEQFAKEQSVFMRRHRMGRSYPVSYGHAFTDWWEKDGKEHPEWFQMLDGGKRGPKKKDGRFSMCVSNAELQREIVKRWTEKRGAGNTNSCFINACENDILGLCACENCRALDGPAPADYLTYYPPTSKMAGSRFVSDRYAQFWLGIQKQAPAGATVVGYAYFNYFSAPTSGIKLNSNILIGYCPSAGWFPRSEAEHAWMKQQWTGWRETGARLFMRTNHLLDGYCMPFLFTRQFTDEFHHAVKHGMVATDYDSLTGHWATQGPCLYTAFRLHTRPEASADELLAEYCAAFGKAAPQVRLYFDHWEAYTTQSREKLATTMETLQTSRWRNWAKAAHAIYPPECFKAPEKMLEAAAKAVADDAEAAARVKFLQLGLQHAKLCARVSAQLTLADSTASNEEIKRILGELLAFRRAHERSGISNFNHLAWVEDLSWKLSEETKQTPDLYP